MELLTSAFVIVLLTTASAKPIGLSRHDADIPDTDVPLELFDMNARHSSESWESDESTDSSRSHLTFLDLTRSDESSESHSSESSSSESSSSEDSSEERFVTVPPTTAGPATAMTTERRGDALSTNGPIVIDVTPPAPTPPAATPAVGTTPGATTPEIQTAAPITGNRGDI
ncbi:probable serine/threonine-protein kinase DDB_G0286627 [Myripristis murdjan]|uniref:probable serine/threonine-protein kinase DDB_G0286627 n=1 Tax=Myripristis murdjan TaxID=586833 RepID=UPI0011763701|nr:probable serine/threonine-protein kinase DDB_G0286627 [Myripristis murdjan]